MSTGPRFLPVGESAVSVEFGDGITAALFDRVRALDQALRAARPSWLAEAVPTYRSLLVVFDPRARSEVMATLATLAAAPPLPAPEGRCHEVPVVYGGADGPDLEEVARHCGTSAAEFAARHAAGAYTAFMLGFRPGFAYLGLLPPDLETPRRSTPRVQVAQGSVAVAGRQTAVYPQRSPGGWNLIGRTSLPLFDPRADPPVRLQPGDRVVFRPVDRLEEVPPPGSGAAPAVTPCLEVVDAGLLTTVQDRGRRGQRRLGVPWGGAMDETALAAANAAVGNGTEAAVLECLLQGPTLRFLRAVRFAVAGALLSPVLERADLGPWPVPPGHPVLARPGNVLRFAGRVAGCRAFIAFEGGVDVPRALDSRATDLIAGFGGLEGRALRAGDRLGVLAPRYLPGAHSLRPPRDVQLQHLQPPEQPELRVVLGPQDDAFAPEAQRAFLEGEYEVQPDSDRVGCRLRGPALAHRGGAEIVSDGMLPGCVQVPPDGQPIVMGADGPTTGGYPKIATVIGADLWRIGQIAPGEVIRFRAVAIDEALSALGVR